MIYLASPYSKCPLGREQAFIEACRAAAVLMKHGHIVYSPIVHSHPICEHGNMDAVNHDFWMGQDMPFLQTCDELRVLMLPGWRESAGVNEEIQEAKCRYTPVVYMEWEDPSPVAETVTETILDEAARITSGDRNGDYGHPADHWERTIGMVNALFGASFETRDWGKMMQLDKIARDQHKPKRDNLVDVCGYARCMEKVDEREAKRPC